MSDKQERTPGEHVVGPASELVPGERMIIKVLNMEIGVFNVGGNLYALHGMCPHQFGPACRGPIGGQAICEAETGYRLQLTRDGEILTCPWHGMEFDVTTGQSLSSAKVRLRSFPVRVVDGEIRVQVGGRAAAE